MAIRTFFSRSQAIFAAAAAAVVCVTSASGCAGDDAGAGAGGTTIDWTTSAAGSGPGGSNAGGTGGVGAGGGGGVGASTSSGSAGAGGSAGSGGGGGPGGVVLVLAGGASSVLAGRLDPNQGWVSQTLGGATTDAPALTISGAGIGIGVLRQVGSGMLRWTSWTSGNWSGLADVAALLTTRAAPALAADGSAAQLTFHGDDYMHYYGRYQSGWAPTAEPVKPPSLPQSFGPSAARIAQLGADMVVCFAGNDAALYAQTRSANAWQDAVGVGPSKIALPPAVAALSSGPELMVAYVHSDANQSDDKKIFWATRSAGQWSAPVKISDNIFTDEPPALAALAAGHALLAFRGTDGKAYSARYDPGSNPPWSAAFGVASPNPTVSSPPAVAVGVGGYDAELVYVDAGDGSVRHARLTGQTWSSPPVVVGGTALVHAAVASAP